MKFIITIFTLLVTQQVSAKVNPDWSSNTSISPTGRPNPYEWDETTLDQKIRQGNLYALNYPVSVTGLLLPSRPVLKILNSQPGEPLFALIKTALSIKPDFKDFQGFWKWLGLHDYPATESQNIPFANHERPLYPMGVSLIHQGPKSGGIDGFTVSCAACHSANLFGKPILGLTNRFPRATLFFVFGSEGFHRISTNTFSVLTQASREEKAMYSRSRERIQSVGFRRPQKLGLDSSIAQPALSLAKRELTPEADRNLNNAKHPRPNLLDHQPVDAKPAVWWNLKYKTRWLSDGSVVSGNPIFTNFLWNEIGRGTDLPELENWLTQNSSIVEDLTTAVFANEAPKWRDFFGENSIQISRAKKGERIFEQTCSRCHGHYEKTWSGLHPTDTVHVRYFETTPLKDVGTDPYRYLGMQSLADGLNPLTFSKKFGILIEPQKAYVPSPLEGIWARYPYLHNNSVPNLCVLLIPPSERPTRYYSGEALDKERDYDQKCMGYPTGAAVPSAWKKNKDFEFNTRITGLSNQGHYDRILLNSRGQEIYSTEEKMDLIEFLKTL